MHGKVKALGAFAQFSVGFSHRRSHQAVAVGESCEKDSTHYFLAKRVAFFFFLNASVVLPTAGVL